MFLADSYIADLEKKVFEKKVELIVSEKVWRLTESGYEVSMILLPLVMGKSHELFANQHFWLSKHSSKSSMNTGSHKANAEKPDTK
jgi:hypothetical protein